MDNNDDVGRYLSTSSVSIPDVIVESAWHRHGPFAFHLVSNLKPRVFVELGTQHGFSYFCFCQAVRDQNLGTSCFAVDTWEGDDHAGLYTEEIYHSVQTINQRYLSFSTLMRMTFEKARDYFMDASIDLLHIDGRHYYEDAKEDFESWKPKLSKDAIVIFHDTNVRERNFGVFRLFYELANAYPTFEFVHGHGLGVLAFGSVPDFLKPFFEANSQQTNLFRKLYSDLGAHIVDMISGAHLSAVISQRDAELAAARAEISTLRAEIEHLNPRLVEHLQAELHQARAALRHMTKRVAETCSID